MITSELYDSLAWRLTDQLHVLQDKPEETPLTTLRALWFTAAGTPKSAQAAAAGELPVLSKAQASRLEELVERRLQGVPLAHMTQRQQFMGIELMAGPQALIPRKETELLGRYSCEILNEMARERDKVTVIDVCTGAGNLAIAYALSEIKAQVYAADLSEDAVALAKQNVRLQGLDSRVRVRQGDLLEPFNSEEFHKQVDLLSCNPPYISSGKVVGMHEEISAYEPRLAFDGGPFGVKILQRLITEAPRYLRPGGWLAFEVGAGQGPAMIQRLTKTGAFRHVKAVEDHNGEIRAVAAQFIE